MADDNNSDRDDQVTDNETDDNKDVGNEDTVIQSDDDSDNKDTYSQDDFNKSGVDKEEFERTKKALAKANKEAEARRKKLKEWEELGVDPDNVKQLLEEQRKAERKRMEDEGRYRELLQQLEETSESEKQQLRKEYEDQLNRMRQNLEREFVDRNITEAIVAEGANPKLLSRHVRDQVKLIEDDDGAYKVVVMDEAGNPRLKRGGNYMGVSDLLKELKNDDAFAVAFPAPDVSGSGSDSSSRRASGDLPPTGKKRGDMTIQERAEYRAKYGKEAYEKLPL